VTRRLVLVLAATLLAVGGCAPGSDDRRLTVFAAASLTGTLTELADRFEREHDGVRVVLAFAGSSDLAAQVVEGAPADVFVAADERTMNIVTDAGLADGEPEILATNTLQLVVPPDNPGGVTSVADLARVDTVLCASQVPCGSAARRLLQAVGVSVRPVSEEQSVTDVLGKVRSGEADAGLVYLTDARAAGDDVVAIDVPEAKEVVNRVPGVVLDDADEPELARAFLDLVSGPAGRTVLDDAGFGAP